MLRGGGDLVGTVRQLAGRGVEDARGAGRDHVADRGTDDHQQQDAGHQPDLGAPHPHLDGLGGGIGVGVVELDDGVARGHELVEGEADLRRHRGRHAIGLQPAAGGPHFGFQPAAGGQDFGLAQAEELGARGDHGVEQLAALGQDDRLLVVGRDLRDTPDERAHLTLEPRLVLGCGVQVFEREA